MNSDKAVGELLDEHEEASARWRFSHERVVAEINDGADRKRLDAARQSIESAFSKLRETRHDDHMEFLLAVIKRMRDAGYNAPLLGRFLDEGKLALRSLGTLE